MPKKKNKQREKKLIEEVLTAEIGELGGAGEIGGALRAAAARFVDGLADEVAGRTVVADVEVGQTAVLAVRAETAADAARLGPHHGRVVARRRFESDGNTVRPFVNPKTRHSPPINVQKRQQQQQQHRPSLRQSKTQHSPPPQKKKT